MLDKVRIQQTQHLVLDTRRVHDNSALLEEEKIQATAERLQQKEIMSQVGQAVSDMPPAIVAVTSHPKIWEPLAISTAYCLLP